MSGGTEPAVKTALVTGAAKRIGRATAIALARNGVNVVVHYHVSRAEAESTAASVQELGVRAWVLSCDLADAKAADALIPRAIEAAGPLSILINSASVFPEDTLITFTAEALQTAVQINAFAPLLLSRRFVAQAIEGNIVNLLDTRVHDYDRSHVSYHLSKRMLHSLTRIMADEFAPRVRVNAVAPGLVLPPHGRDESYLESLAPSNPLRRIGTLAGVTDAVLFLLRSDYTTGQVIYVDGGRHMRSSVYA